MFLVSYWLQDHEEPTRTQGLHGIDNHRGAIALSDAIAFCQCFLLRNRKMRLYADEDFDASCGRINFNSVTKITQGLGWGWVASSRCLVDDGQ